jgi:alpha-glucosidase
VTVNGVAVKHAGATGKGGWSFEGNTLTTVIPVASGSVETKVTVEVRRAEGLTARRSELDGFAGAMTRLRGAYDAMNQTWPVSDPPEALVDAMQAGDRLGYHPEKAQAEMTHFRETLPKAQADLSTLGSGFNKRMDEFAKRLTRENWRPSGLDMEAQKKHRLDALARAQRLVEEAGK